jgi:hypothetical protein
MNLIDPQIGSKSKFGIKITLETQNKFEKVGVFLNTKRCLSKDHLSPQIHHKQTTKKPRSNGTISQNPL